MYIRKRKFAYAVKASLLTLCILLCAGQVVAVPPMSVHRTNDAATVRGSTPVASAVQSPYDDASGILDDGQMYVYYVEDAAGVPVLISAHKNLPLNTVRISFDDEDPLSAPVDAARSTVTVAPAGIPADGSSTILVTIIPRDALGVPLGTGLGVTLQGSALWPGALLGSVTDRGDGTYTARILSSVPGQGEVWAVVEGIALTTEPSVTYESTGGPLSLRDEAVLQTDSIVTPGGAVDQLVEGLDPAVDPGAKKVLDAKKKINEALAEFDKNDPKRDDDALKRKLKEAVGHLVSALDNPGDVDPQALVNLIEDLLEISRKVALHYRDAALAACGPCTGGGNLCKAEQSLAEGDAEWASPSPDYEKVVDKYAKAVEAAVRAVGECS